MFGLGNFSDIQSLQEHFDNQPIISGDSGKMLIEAGKKSLTVLMTLYQFNL